MKRQTRFVVAALVLVGAVAYLMYTGVSQTAIYYLTIGEFLEKKDTLANEGVRVAGRVALGTVTKKMTPTGEELNFQIGDFEADNQPVETVAVHYVGVTPDMFKAGGGSDVIVEGTYRDGVLYAQSLLTSCPSKYEADVPQDAARN